MSSMFVCPAVSSKGSSAGFSQVRDLLKKDFNRSVELQVQTESLLLWFPLTVKLLLHRLHMKQANPSPSSNVLALKCLFLAHSAAVTRITTLSAVLVRI